ncbi:MAG: OprD family outer membrane porin [Sulfuricurvum sp.]|uniref:OprD family outer membrane porin n=1 Tax=Sulfuricurvum sp. TaxID=2025608 RepID=UPI0026305BAC|nr:OprD family outer membrane porin [Sulfuricurvum sp.]MDD2949907.1 OprD family outer membrane porin [Sulfuricurvum sp.]MDD5117035.1 OprD family outer membrane porin [Sulfuricurvum sp.]
MKKALMMSFAIVAALSGETIDEAFNEGKASGQLRITYVNQDNAVDIDTYGTSLGGQLKYETGRSNNVKLGIAAYISQKIGYATGDEEEGKANHDLFAANAKSYAYIGEGYIDYSANDFSLRVGRQLIDTPLADTDDIRMHRNSFEAAIATYSGIDKTTLVGGYITRWAGYDSGDDITHFKKLDTADSHGAAIVGILNESVENLAVQGWYYGIDNVSNILYTDATYMISVNELIDAQFSGQYGYFAEKKSSDVDGSVYGIAGTFNIGMVSLGAAYNKTINDNGKTIVNGFGGGPYFTSMEEMSIGSMEDAKAYQLSGELDLASIGIKGLMFSALYGNFKSAPADLNVKEIDLIAAYQISEAFSAEMSYAMIGDKNKNRLNDGIHDYDGGYDYFLLRMSYNF